MPAQTEIIDMISDTAGIGKIGLLSPADDCVISFAGGKLIKKYLDGSERHTMNLQLQGKGTNQLKLADKLCGICDALTHKRPRTFPKTDEWEVCGVSFWNSSGSKRTGRGWHMVLRLHTFRKLLLQTKKGLIE